eukprot:UN06201
MFEVHLLKNRTEIYFNQKMLRIELYMSSMKNPILVIENRALGHFLSVRHFFEKTFEPKVGYLKFGFVCYFLAYFCSQIRFFPRIVTL